MIMKKAPALKGGSFLYSVIFDLQQLFKPFADRRNELFAVDLFYVRSLAQKSQVAGHNAALDGSRQAFSSLPAKSIRGAFPSISPRLRNAPVQAKIVAMGFELVCSPLRYL
jgi:hypothetical protein